MTGPIQLSADSVVYSFSARQPDAVMVESGTVVMMETRDAYDRCFQRSLDIGEYL